ncbi:MAG: molybdopterin-guanine dinucleotide biosynthesis protein B [Planctomycetes bacterium]|nr:molybdopterin-guanine dinucleotide biosynthesis protein B [Planctomycetota bacterium]
MVERGSSPRLIQIVGWSGSGKTTLLEALLPLWKQRGLRVAAIKHSGGFPELDTPGKDSYRLRSAGAEAVVLVGPERSAVFVDHEPEFFPWEVWVRTLAGLGADLIAFESFGKAPIPKVEVWRPEVGEAGLRWGGDPLLRAVVAASRPPAWAGALYSPAETDRISAELLHLALPFEEVLSR